MFFDFNFFISPQTGWVTGIGTILHTTNSGLNWNSQNIGVNPIGSLFFTSPLNGWVVAFELYKTTNGGINWVYSPIPNNPLIFDIFFINPNTGYASGFGGAVYKTSNAGMNWSLSSVGKSTELYSVRFTSPDTGWVVGSNGAIFKTTTGGEPLGINYISSALPDRIYLYQNYPNPFNPSTKIKYELTGNEYVTLKIFDILGKLIKALVHEKQNAGTYETEFDASDMPSGIYFYTLNAGSYIETKRMVLLK
ncbi:MAG: T9SS type A sorting domain-containing protein [Ignavibacteria bacterium]|nr:T9SS type A sorting domain-containing protein [Ignavibacteria bacterium]